MTTNNRTRLHISFDDIMEVEMDPNAALKNGEMIYDIVKTRIVESLKNNLDEVLKKIKIEVSDLDIENEGLKHHQRLKRRQTTHHFDSMPKIFEYLMVKRKPIKKRLLKKKSNIDANVDTILKKNFSVLKDTDKPAFRKEYSELNLKDSDSYRAHSKSYEDILDYDKKDEGTNSLEGNNSLEEEKYSEKDLQNPFHFNAAQDEKTGLNLLNCDSFRETYESTLCTSTESNNRSVVDFSKNYHLLILFGNISYSIGMYERARTFYNSALHTVNLLTQEKNIENINIALLEINIGRSLINDFKVKEGLEHLNTAKEKLENSDTLYSSILKLHINYDLAEANFLIDNFETSINLLIEIYEVLSKRKSILESEEKTRMLCKYYFTVGKIFLKTNNYCIAQENFICAKSLSKELKGECVFQAELYNSLSIAQLKQNEYEKAVESSEKCINIFTEIYGANHPKTLMAATNLSYIYQHNSENRKALELLQATLKTATMNKELDDIFMAIIYRAIGNCYFNIGNERQGLVNFSKANIIYKEYVAMNCSTISGINLALENMYGMINV
jgi:tetratricopeptide (TPR) repeat protein